MTARQRQPMNKFYRHSQIALLTLWLTAIFSPYNPAQAEPSTTTQLDALVQQWLALEQQQHQLQQDWQLRKQSLQQGINLLQAEQKQLQQVLERNNKQHDAVDEKRTALL